MLKLSPGRLRLSFFSFSQKKPFPLYKAFCLLLALFSSCQAFKSSKPVIKIGEQSWSFEEAQAYMELRLSHSGSQQSPTELKELFLKEILFQSLLKDWSKREKIKFKRGSWSPESFALFFTDPSKLKALQKRQSFILLKSALRESLKNQIPAPELKTQKEFYQKNKALFKEPAQCELKQILTENEKIALSLYNRIKKGESFSVLAQNHSLKGHPGWVKKGQLEVFDQACFKIQTALTSPLKSPYGYHIFLKTGSKPSKQKSFAESQEQILSYLREKEIDLVFQNWLKEESLKKSFWIDKKSLDQIKFQYKRGAR